MHESHLRLIWVANVLVDLMIKISQLKLSKNFAKPDIGSLIGSMQKHLRLSYSFYILRLSGRGPPPDSKGFK